MTKLREITDYLRRAVATQGNRTIDFKKEIYIQATSEEIQIGKINPNAFRDLTKRDKRCSDKEEIPVFIAGKTIKTSFDEQAKVMTQINDLTGIFFIPALLSKEGYFQPYEEKDKNPWIPREFLTPNIDSVLAVGDSKRLDDFLSDSVGKKYKIENWSQYFNYAKDLFEYTCEVPYECKNLKNGEELDDNIYIFKDNSVNATRGILSLYDHMLRENDEENTGSVLKADVPTYENFVSLKPKSVEPLINNELPQMKMHSGQMGGEYPLSPSQRECINHYVNMKEGDVLAVNGPPGTGKTTLLQSVVADKYVKSALSNIDPPVIVASSTNNQAVTNIIESFGNLSKIGMKNLEERWITGVHSFATYFPASSKKGEAEEKGYQYTDKKGYDFIERIEAEENIRDSKKKFQQCFNDFYNVNFPLDKMEEKLKSELKKVNNIKKEILTITDKLGDYLENVTFNKYVDNLNAEKKATESEILLRKNRLQEWKEHFKSIPLLYKILSFIPRFRKKITSDNMAFVDLSEDFLEDDMSIEGICYKYGCMLKELRGKVRRIDETIEIVTDLQENYNFYVSKELKTYLNDEQIDKFKRDLDISKLNETLDTTLRYIQFWLAVHYYEYQWLSGKDQIPRNKKHTTFEDILKQR